MLRTSTRLPGDGPVPRPATGASAILPVTYNDLYPLAKEYAEAGLQVLAKETAAFAGDVAAATWPRPNGTG